MFFVGFGVVKGGVHIIYNNCNDYRWLTIIKLNNYLFYVNKFQYLLRTSCASYPSLTLTLWHIIQKMWCKRPLHLCYVFAALPVDFPTTSAASRAPLAIFSSVSAVLSRPTLLIAECNALESFADAALPRITSMQNLEVNNFDGWWGKVESGESAMLKV